MGGGGRGKTGYYCNLHDHTHPLSTPPTWHPTTRGASLTRWDWRCCWVGSVVCGQHPSLCGESVTGQPGQGPTGQPMAARAETGASRGIEAGWAIRSSRVGGAWLGILLCSLLLLLAVVWRRGSGAGGARRAGGCTTMATAAVAGLAAWIFRQRIAVQDSRASVNVHCDLSFPLWRAAQDRKRRPLRVVSVDIPDLPALPAAYRRPRPSQTREAPVDCSQGNTKPTGQNVPTPFSPRGETLPRRYFSLTALLLQRSACYLVP